MSHRRQPRPGGEQLLKLVEQEFAVVVDRCHTQHSPGLLTKDLPGDNVGVMLHRGDEDFVARPDILAPVALSHEVDGLCGPTDVDDFPRLAGVDEARHLPTRLLVGLGSALAKLVHPAVDVRVVRRKELFNGVYDDLWFLRRSSIVKIDQRLAADLHSQDREVLSDLLDVETGRPVQAGHFSDAVSGGDHQAPSNGSSGSAHLNRCLASPSRYTRIGSTFMRLRFSLAKARSSMARAASLAMPRARR